MSQQTVVTISKQKQSEVKDGDWVRDRMGRVGCVFTIDGPSRVLFIDNAGCCYDFLTDSVRADLTLLSKVEITVHE